MVSVNGYRVARADPLARGVLRVAQWRQLSLQLHERTGRFLGRVENVVHHDVRRERGARDDNVVPAVYRFPADFAVVYRRKGVYA
ncbi:hypothetical protein D3C81_1867350 [compost metagenome]